MALTTYLQNTSTYLKNGATQDVSGVQFPQQVGVPVQSLYMFTVVPVALNTTCISPSNAWISTGQPLNTNMQGIAPNIATTPITIKGQKGLILDCERCVKIIITGTQTATYNNSATVTGYDRYYNPVTISINFTVTSGSSTTTLFLITPVLIVTSVIFASDFSHGSGGITATVGTSNYIGLPYYLGSKAFVLASTWGGNAVASSFISTGYQWRNGNTTAFTGSPRGYITTPSAADGSTMLTCYYYSYGADREISSEVNVLNQSSLKVAQVQPNTTTGVNVLPSITKYDLTGVVYPADIKFINAYKKLLS